MTDTKYDNLTLPAGKYWIGDPCYAIPDSDWDDFLDIWSHKIEGRAEYGIDCLNWLLGNRPGPQPKVWEYKDV